MKKKISDLEFDRKNANRHSQFGMGLLENSTRDNGIGRSILISKDNVIIAGNGLVEAAGSIGIEDVEIVESDGKKIIAVRRNDIQSGTPEFYKMALADNIVPLKNIVLDAEVVEAIATEVPGVQYWTDLAHEIINPKKRGEGSDDLDRANQVQKTFVFSSLQSADVDKALKISKKIFKRRFSKSDNENQNGNALYFIIQEFLKKYGKTKLEP